MPGLRQWMDAPGATLAEKHLAYLRGLRERFAGGEAITENDVLAAFEIIQLGSRLHSRGENYGIIDHLCRCAIEILAKSKVRLSEGNLAYIRQKMPFERFIDRVIAELEAEMNEQKWEGKLWV